MPRSIIFAGGIVYDGTGSTPFQADVGVSGDTISFVGSRDDMGADEVIDISGLALAPGFIDTHAHSEFTLLADPQAGGKVLQGVTTEINGNCGLSAAPLLAATKERREPDLKEYGIKERWETFEEYFKILEGRRPAFNVMTLVGHGNIRGAVVGYQDRPATPEELERMQQLLVQALRAGAMGMSSGLIYPPGIYTPTEELIALAKRGREEMGPSFIYTTHMRSEGDRLLESIEETLRIGREAGARVHISHIKTASRKNWHKAADVVRLLEEARDAGIDVTCDRYPYTASATDLDAVLPAWAFEGGNEAELARLKDDEMRKRLVEDMPADESRWSEVVVSSVESDRNRWMEGMSLMQIARKRGQEPRLTVLDVLFEENLRVGAIFHSMNEQNLQTFLGLPYTMVGSDSSARSLTGPVSTGKPHPRGFGTFPRFLHMFRDRLPEAIHKVSGLPAHTFNLAGRGNVKEGFSADLVVFDPDTVTDTATYAEPFQAPRGISHVMVNGGFSVRDGKLTAERPGRVLRGGLYR